MITVNNKNLCEACFAETDSAVCKECGFTKGNNADKTVLEMGSVLEDRYLIGKVIGKGGFGITYLAYDMKLQCRVAIKEYYPYGVAVRESGTTTVSVSSADSADTFRVGASKFYEEARLVAGFNGNPNIVSVYDFFYGNDTVYFTMGYLKGITLKAYIAKNGPLTIPQTVRVANDICSALMVAHSENVLHRDISPDNIMVCNDGTIKLLDFGAARQVFTDESKSLSVILKQGFAPLEQYQKKGKQGPWTDIYSLGATLVYSLTRKVMDDPMTRIDDDEEFLSNPYDIPDGLWQILVKATMVKAVDRYQDVFELKEALDNLEIAPEPLVTVDYRAKARFRKAEPVDTASAVGVTVPAKESAVGVTAPAKESAVGVTVSARDDTGVTAYAGDTGITTAVSEETAPEKKKSKVGAGIAIGVAAAAVIAFIAVFAGKGNGEDKAAVTTTENTSAEVSAETSLALSEETRETEEKTSETQGSTSASTVSETSVTTTAPETSITTTPESITTTTPEDTTTTTSATTTETTTTATTTTTTATAQTTTTTATAVQTTTTAKTTEKTKKTTTTAKTTEKTKKTTTAKTTEKTKKTTTTTEKVAPAFDVDYKTVNAPKMGISFKVPDNFTDSAAGDEFLYIYTGGGSDDLILFAENIDCLVGYPIFSYKDGPEIVNDLIKSLGFSSYEITSEQFTKFAGRDAYRCDFVGTMNGVDYNCTRIFFDQKHEFGCTSVLALYNTEREELKQPAQDYLDSIKVTGTPASHQNDGIIFYPDYDFGIGFVYADYMAVKAPEIMDSEIFLKVTDKSGIFIGFDQYDLSLYAQVWADEYSEEVSEMREIDLGGKHYTYFSTEHDGYYYLYFQTTIDGKMITVRGVTDNPSNDSDLMTQLEDCVLTYLRLC